MFCDVVQLARHRSCRDPQLTNFVEHPEAVADRLEWVAQVVGNPKRVSAGTDCGFGTSVGSSRVAKDVMRAKFRAMAVGHGIGVQVAAIERTPPRIAKMKKCNMQPPV